MDAYQNLISGDKGAMPVQGNCSGWLLPLNVLYRMLSEKSRRLAISMLASYTGWFPEIIVLL